MLPLRPRSGACCHLGRQMPTGRLLAIIHPAHDDADQNASNDRSRQIVPQQQTPLSKRHTAALLQWQPFAAILELLRFEISPRDVARLIPNNVRGFSLSSNLSIDAAGVQAPATLRLTGQAGLPTILRRPSDLSTRLDCVIRGAFHSLRPFFLCQPYQQLQAGGVIVVLGINLRLGLLFTKG
ncbi:hypothetical protein HMPREF9693_03099 [Klebsiella oxytoca 10-5249]|nr:hypothetical protein HMPREF9693_03099 [Klebsiella oxytoca 10-5249]